MIPDYPDIALLRANGVSTFEVDGSKLRITFFGPVSVIQKEQTEPEKRENSIPVVPFKEDGTLDEKEIPSDMHPIDAALAGMHGELSRAIAESAVIANPEPDTNEGE